MRLKLLLIALLTLSVKPLFADDFRRDRASLQVRVGELEQRIADLEDEVKRLERVSRRVYLLDRRLEKLEHLSHANEHVPVLPRPRGPISGRLDPNQGRMFVCYLSGGRELYVGKGVTERLARDRTLRECESGHDRFCDMRYVSCGEER